MIDSDLDNLEKALSQSPENSIIRLLVAEELLKRERFTEAENHYRMILEKETNNTPAKIGLSKIYFVRKNFATSIIILEEIIDSINKNPELLILLSKAYLNNKESSKAIEYYQKSLKINPALTDSELDENLRKTSGAGDVNELLNSLEENLKFEKPKITFEQVGGMIKVKEEIKIKIIQPLQHPELYKAYGKKIGGGILMYGPPGCGKTHLARATAGQINAKFMAVGIHDVLDMWLGNSEKQLHELFEVARRETPCVLFFDEIDGLGASRSDMRNSSSKMLINQFLNELDGIQSSNDGLLVLAATNAPWHLDSAFRRPGRFDRIIFVSPPDFEGRESILRIMLKDKPINHIEFGAVAKNTDGYSGADLMALVDRTIEDKLRDSFEKGIVQPISTKDLLNQTKSLKPSTKDWFVSARNYALYSNESGLYDEILDYLKIKK
jgi:transitional endoplasmic reticulum ATPase